MNGTELVVYPIGVLILMLPFYFVMYQSIASKGNNHMSRWWVILLGIFSLSGLLAYTLKVIKDSTELYPPFIALFELIPVWILLGLIITALRKQGAGSFTPMEFLSSIFKTLGFAFLAILVLFFLMMILVIAVSGGAIG